MISDYLKIARIDHWIKQLFIIPGVLVAFLLVDNTGIDVILKCLLALISTSFIASANYIINEYLDAEFDKYHPIKKNRTLARKKLNKFIIIVEYILFVAIGLFVAFFLSKIVMLLQITLLLMGILYNVKPFRLKDIAYLDVLTESINNAIRFLIGWYSVTSEYYPPISIVFGYWMVGAYLMTIKRFAEYMMIDNKEVASQYRKSFKYYNKISLLVYAFFFALMSVFFCGIFLIKYKIELLLTLPFFIGLFCYYLYIAFKDDSPVQRVEKLYKEKFLMIYLLILIIIFIISMLINIPALKVFDSVTLFPM